MQIVVTFLASGMLTNSAVHLVRIQRFEEPSSIHLPTPFFGDIIDLATGNSSEFYDVADWQAATTEELASCLRDYLANCDSAQLLTPIHDPHNILP